MLMLEDQFRNWGGWMQLERDHKTAEIIIFTCSSVGIRIIPQAFV